MVALPEPRHIRRCILTAWLLSRATSIMHRLFISFFWTQLYTFTITRCLLVYRRRHCISGIKAVGRTFVQLEAVTVDTGLGWNGDKDAPSLFISAKR